MIRRKSAVALAVMCALAISAVAVASASATSAFTCAKGAGTFRGPHCLSTGSAAAEYGHESFTGSTSFTVTNANTASETTAAAISVLGGSISGVATELQCTTMSGTGTLENTGTVAKGTGVIAYTGCTVLKPSGKGCKVKGEAINTNSLAAETNGAANLKYKPASGETFAAIVIEGCTVTALNNTFPVTGSLEGTVTGGTTTTTEAGITTQGTLKFGGNKAGLGGAWTTRGPNGNAFSLT
jgi:hypothetical protein